MDTQTKHDLRTVSERTTASTDYNPNPKGSNVVEVIIDRSFVETWGSCARCEREENIAESKGIWRD